jgi:hypothetical protein
MEKQMSAQRSRVFAKAVSAIAVAIVILASPHISAAQAPDDANLIGGWRVTFGDGTSLGDIAVLLVNEGGTTNLRVMDGDRAEGVWIKVARRLFALTFDEFDDTNRDGVPERYRIRATIQLLNRNTMTGTAIIDEMSADGSVVLENEGQGTFEGARMLVERE